MDVRMNVSYSLVLNMHACMVWVSRDNGLQAPIDETNAKDNTLDATYDCTHPWHLWCLCCLQVPQRNSVE